MKKIIALTILASISLSYAGTLTGNVAYEGKLFNSPNDDIIEFHIRIGIHLGDTIFEIIFLLSDHCSVLFLLKPHFFLSQRNLY